MKESFFFFFSCGTFLLRPKFLFVSRGELLLGRKEAKGLGLHIYGLYLQRCDDVVTLSSGRRRRMPLQLSTMRVVYVDTRNSENNVDEKLAEGFFEGKISGSKRREGERFAEIC